MSLYIHHVPGRLRVRTQAFRCQPSRIRAAADRLAGLDGIQEVAANAQAGSITVHYDPQLRTQAELLGLLEDFGCAGVRRTAGAEESQVASLFGKALIGALAQNLAQRSVLGLVSVLR